MKNNLKTVENREFKTWKVTKKVQLVRDQELLTAVISIRDLQQVAKKDR